MAKGETLARWKRRAADKIQQEVWAMLGGRCEACGSTEELEIDHPAGRTWDIRKLNRWQRWRRYREEAKRGQVRLLCKRDNGHDGNRRQWAKKGRV